MTDKRERGIRRVVVVVPARDEEWLIGRCLTALVAASQALTAQDPEVSVRLVVVADACTDATETRCREFVEVEVISTSLGRVGAARALGVERGLVGLSDEDLEHTWIANTDADSAVPVNWLTHQMELADAGVDVMIGTVTPDPAELTETQWGTWRRTHSSTTPNGHVHGANLGLRASHYRAVGGFEPLDEHEDNHLVNRLRELDAVIVPSNLGDVLTSARLVGRTPGGYAGFLAGTL